VGEDRTARRERVGLLAGESKTAGCERGGRLGVRGLCCWAGERLTTVALLSGRGQDC